MKFPVTIYKEERRRDGGGSFFSQILPEFINKGTLLKDEKTPGVQRTAHNSTEVFFFFFILLETLESPPKNKCFTEWILQ